MLVNEEEVLAEGRKIRFADSADGGTSVHIGKTGGKPIIQALKIAGNSQAYRVMVRGPDASLKEIPEGQKFFFIVRDPIERFISACGTALLDCETIEHPSATHFDDLRFR